MSDYTPTTEEVIGLQSLLTENGMAEEFDRWLAEVKAQAWQEGYGEGAAANYGDYRDAEFADNPYRQGEEQ